MGPSDDDDSSTRRPSDNDDSSTRRPSDNDSSEDVETSEDVKYTTEEPTMAPTEKWTTKARRLEEGNDKCKTDASSRAFRLDFTSLDNCIDRCHQDANCMFASTDAKDYCIGCKVLNA